MNKIKKVKIKKKLPKFKFPAGQAYDYFTAVKDLLDKTHDNVIKTYKNKIAYLRQDGFKTDDDDILKINLILDILRDETFDYYFTDNNIEKAVNTFTLAIKNHVDNQFSKQYKAILGVDPIGRDTKLSSIIQAANKENISYIKSIPSNYHDKVQTIILQGVRRGKSYSEISDELQRVYDVSRDKAMFIARDQAGSLTGDLTKARHEAVGLKTFVWRTVGDSRVRTAHDKLEGLVFTWEDGEPDKGMRPGEDYGCRCTADINEEELMNL